MCKTTGIVPADEVLKWQRTGNKHPGGMNVGYRSGAARFLSEAINEAKLLRQLGRE